MIIAFDKGSKGNLGKIGISEDTCFNIEKPNQACTLKLNSEEESKIFTITCLSEKCNFKIKTVW